MLRWWRIPWLATHLLGRPIPTPPLPRLKVTLCNVPTAIAPLPIFENSPQNYFGGAKVKIQKFVFGGILDCDWEMNPAILVSTALLAAGMLVARWRTRAGGAFHPGVHA